MGVGTPAAIDPARLQAIRLWTRRRADGKSALARRIHELRIADRTHEQIRIDRGLTVERYKRAKQWMNDALAGTSDYVSFEEALRDHADRQVELITRFAALKNTGATRLQIMERLALSGEGWDATFEWFRDALSATEPREDMDDHWDRREN